MPHSPRHGLTRLGRYLPVSRPRAAFLVVMAALTATVQVAVWFIVRDAVDNGMRAHDGGRLELDVALYMAMNVGAWALGAFVIRGLAAVGQGIVLNLRRDLFGHLTSLSLRYFSEQRAGWIIARLTSDVDAVSDVLSEGLLTLVTAGLTLVVALTAIFVVDVRLALVTFVILPPAIAISRWYQVRGRKASLEVRERVAITTAALAESIAGMAVIQAFNRQPAFQAQFDALNEDQRRASQRAQTLASVFFPSTELLGILATAAVLYVGERLHHGGGLTVGTLVAFVGLLTLLFAPLQDLSELYGQVQSAAAAMVKITIVLDTEVEIRSRPDAVELGRIDGRIDLDAVSFAYGDKVVLHGVDLHVPPGGCLALVGESGGGKSTTAKLVARFYDPLPGGAVRVDGRDLREVELGAYRRQLGVVLQDPFLFSGTIATNLRFARPDATDAEIADVAHAVGLDRVAARFVDGLEHVVREGGAGLSAGERQLISIARALLADPRILILDEATSNIDRPSEVLIEKALDRLLAGRTSLIIAHRLSTVRRADEIVVVEHGRIAQRGRFDALLVEAGPFRRLARELATTLPTMEGDAPE